MAIGDIAAAAGLTVFADTQDHGLGYENDNQRGDDIVNYFAKRVTVQNATPSGVGHSIGDIWIKSAT